MKKRNGIILGSIVLVILIIVIYCISSYNSLVRAQEGVQAAKSNISVQIQRRADLIPNLVETVRGYAAHEEGVFTALAEARERMVNGGTIEEQLEADNQLNQALSTVFAISENYPELKASETFINLQDELAGAENRITKARTDYNGVAQTYNQSIRLFPKSIIANLGGFTAEPYFELSEGAESVPEVNFD